MGLDCDLKFLGKVRVEDKYENEISYTYVGEISKEQQIRENPEEPGKFFTKEEIKNLENTNKVTPYMFESLSLYLKQKEGLDG